MFKADTQKRSRKQTRVRKKISGSTERPRISIFRSNNEIYAQLIDDSKNCTLVAASSLSKEIAEELKAIKTKTAKAKVVGKLLAKLAVEKGFSVAVFDRGGYQYHGRVKAVAEGAREGGLKF
jgi:large subunit ribosomal protein L18